MRLLKIRTLTEVLLDKDRHASTVTKYFVDNGADLDMWSNMFFEGKSITIRARRKRDGRDPGLHPEVHTRRTSHTDNDFWQDWSSVQILLHHGIRLKSFERLWFSLFAATTDHDDAREISMVRITESPRTFALAFADAERRRRPIEINFPLRA